MCQGRIYYLPNCNKNDIDYIGYTNEECETKRHGLESMGLSSKSEKYLSICGNQYIKYCIKVDDNNNVFYTNAYGYRPNATCNENGYKFISNLCDCNYDLKSKCVNTQKFKLAECTKITSSSISILNVYSLLFILLLCIII